MSSKIDLYQHLPSIHRIRDAENGYVLRALLLELSSQLDLVRENIEQLWDDFFIETCADWVIPYIGDLVANNALHSIETPTRSDVGKTIYFRRRKGTLPMLEELARDVTGLPMRTVACFELLCWTQNLNHIRMRRTSAGLVPRTVDAVSTANVRDIFLLDRLDGPFDELAHTVDIRPMGSWGGRHSSKKIGFHGWRLRDFPLEFVPATTIHSTWGFVIHPLGIPFQLFTRQAREFDEAERASEIHVPAPIRRLAFHRDTADYYTASKGSDDPKSLAVYLGAAQALVDPQKICSANLSTWRRPSGDLVAVDVVRGRIALGANYTGMHAVSTDHCYAFSAEIGGGPYDRADTLAGGRTASWTLSVGAGKTYPTLAAAMTAWAAAVSSGDERTANAAVLIDDNGSYALASPINLPANGRLTIEAADGYRPTVRPASGDSVEVHASGGPATLRLNGLLFAGGLLIDEGVSLDIVHTTLVPGGQPAPDGSPGDTTLASIFLDPAWSGSGADISVTVENSIVGPIRLPDDAKKLDITDSIVHGFARGTALSDPPIAIEGSAAAKSGPTTKIVRSTILGTVGVTEILLASNSLFTQAVVSDRLQEGCVRFCYVPSEGSRTPRRYRCQPDLAIKELREALGEKVKTVGTEHLNARIAPSFTSIRYGDPAYTQLRATCASEIREGAEDGSEMGAFCHLRMPQREANLRIRWNEYLPFGLEPGVIYET